MAQHYITEAMALTGKSKRTLYRRMDGGELAFTTDNDNRRSLDTSELIRVFGTLLPVPGTVPMAHSDTVHVSQPANDHTNDYIELLREQLKHAQEQLKLSQDREEKLLDQVGHQALIEDKSDKGRRQHLLEHKQGLQRDSLLKRFSQYVTDVLP